MCRLDRPHVRCGRQLLYAGPRFPYDGNGSCAGKPGLSLREYFKNEGRNRFVVTKWVAYALKSRILPLRSIFPQVYTELGLTDSVDEWYQEAVRQPKRL